jgi:hypothetical protein
MFFLKSSSLDDNGNLTCRQLYAGQAGLQKFLIAVADLCIPVMLLGKPIVLYMRHK